MYGWKPGISEPGRGIKRIIGIFFFHFAGFGRDAW